MERWSLRITLAFLIALTLGCTRESTDKSNIALSFDSFAKLQKNGFADNVLVDFIAINVRGPGMNLMKCIYESDRDNDQDSATAATGIAPKGTWSGSCSSDPANPYIVKMNDVPTGSSRLVQVLIITKSESNDSEEEVFSYGEQTKNLSGGDESVGITVTGKVVNMGDSFVSGRYLFADGTGYTGKVAMEYKPISGSPAMEIFEMEMYNGWFNFYLLDTVNLSYRMKQNGHIVFGQALNTSSSVLAINASSVKHVDAPTIYEQDSTNIREKGPLKGVIGFWQGGVAASGKTVCHDTTADTSSHKYLDSAGSNALDWPSDFTFSGGSTCSMTDPPVSASQISVNMGLLLDRGEGVLRGPYAKFLNAHGEYSYINESESGTNLVINWKYLPGVIGAILEGSTVFYTTDAPPELSGHHDGADGLDCNKVASLGLTRTDVNGSANSVTIPGFGQANVGPNPKVIICPRLAGGKLMRSILELGNDEGDSCMNCNGPDPATKLVLKAITKNTYDYINKGACTPFWLEAQTDSGQLGHIDYMGHDVDLVSTTGGFFHDDSCASPISGPLTLYGPKLRVYYETNTAGTTSLSASSNAGESTPLTAYNYPGSPLSVAGTAAAATKVVIRGPATNYKTDCSEYLISLVDANDIPTPYPSSMLQVTPSFPTGDMYDSGDCNGSPYPDYYVNSNETNKLFLYKGSIATAAAGVSWTNDGGYTNANDISVEVIDPVADYTFTSLNGNPAPNVCTEFYIRTYMNISEPHSPPAFPPSNLTYFITITSPDGGTPHLYPTSGECSGNTNEITPSTPVSFPNNSFEKTLYFKTPDGSKTFDVEMEESTLGEDFDEMFTFMSSGA